MVIVDLSGGGKSRKIKFLWDDPDSKARCYKKAAELTDQLLPVFLPILQIKPMNRNYAM